MSVTNTALGYLTVLKLVVRFDRLYSDTAIQPTSEKGSVEPVAIFLTF